jgi:hypothetical protein
VSQQSRGDGGICQEASEADVSAALSRLVLLGPLRPTWQCTVFPGLLRGLGAQVHRVRIDVSQHAFRTCTGPEQNLIKREE